MLEYTLTKRFLAVCLALVLALSCTLAVCAEAEDETPQPDFPSETATPAPDDPEPTEMPDAAATPDPPDETPLPSETPLPDETPPPSETPAPTETPQPTQTPEPTKTPAPSKMPVSDEDLLSEYTIDSAIEFLESNGIMYSASLASREGVGSDIEVRNFPGLHRVYLGSYRGPATVDVSEYLPDLYSRLTFENFYMVPVSFEVSGTGTSSGVVSYDAATGLLTLPAAFVSYSGYWNSLRYDVYCFYNESVVFQSELDETGGSVSLQATEQVGSDIQVRNFPGLHRIYLADMRSNGSSSIDVSQYLPDLYDSLTYENFVIIPYYRAYQSNLYDYSSFNFLYDSSTGILSCSGLTYPLYSSGGKNYFSVLWYELYCIYNVPSEMGTPDETPGGTTIVQVSDPHPFWTTDFSDYTVTEGILFLIFDLMAVFAVVKVFGRF